MKLSRPTRPSSRHSRLRPRPNLDSRSIDHFDSEVLHESFSETYLAAQRKRAASIHNQIQEEISSILANRKVKNRRETAALVEECKLRRMVCSDALDQIADFRLESRDLMAEIRFEYERFLDALSQGQLQCNFVHNQLKKITTGPITIELLRKRKEELETRIGMLNEENQKISNQIFKTKDMQEDSVHEDESSESKLLRSKGTHKTSVLALVPHSAATSVGPLGLYSLKLSMKIKQLSESIASQYTPRIKQTELENELLKKENTEHHLLLYNEKLKERFKNLTLSVEVCILFIYTFNLVFSLVSGKSVASQVLTSRMAASYLTRSNKCA